jgi:CHASE3 domain sensor protein
MKYFLLSCYLIALLFTTSSAFAQKYKTIDDTARLNKEYVSLTNEIVEIKTKLTTAETDLQGYQLKASEANSNAADAASASSDQAEKATNGSVKDAKNAKRKANKSYNEAKISKSAKEKLTKQENIIKDYKTDLTKKQKRIGKLDEMRSAIYAKMQKGTS